MKVSTDDGGTRVNGRCSYSILGTSNWLNFVPVELNEVHSLAGAQIEFFCRRKPKDRMVFVNRRSLPRAGEQVCFLKVWF